MEISLSGAVRRWIVAIVSLGIAAGVAVQACEMWVADRRVESQQLPVMERGVALMPGNGTAWDKLGRMRQWDFMNPDLSGAIEDFWKAVRYDPRSAHYWMDLAAAYEASGDDARARDAYLKAKEVYPASAEVAFYYGNFLLRQEEYPAAYSELRRAVSGDPTLLPLVISRAWRSNNDVEELLANVLPADEEAYVDALDFFASIHEGDAGMAVWHRLVGLHQPVPLVKASAFLEELIQEDRADDARSVWFEALAAAGQPHDPPPNGNLIWNGDFGKEFTNEGLDWRWMDMPNTAMEFDAEAGPNGSRAIRLDFSGGANLSIDEPAEYVAVAPGRAYHFHAAMRTEEITTESGMRFSITDPNHSGVLNVETENLTGSHPWGALDTDFAVGPDTHFVIVRLFRSPSRLFENKLEGAVWIADVSLTPSSAPSTQNSR